MESTPAVIDPVCEMHVDQASAVAVEYDGRTYYFCETTCAETFREDPDRWVPQDALIEA